MDISAPVHRTVKKVSFSFLAPEQVRRQSVKAITSAATFDALNHAVVGGLYDPALGPTDKNGRCATCGLTSFQCPGHFGHIDLCLPVYNPLTFGQLFQLLRLTCLYCHRLRIGPVRVALFWGRLRLLQEGLLMEAMGLETVIPTTDLLATEDASGGAESVSEEDQVRAIHAHVNRLCHGPPMTGRHAPSTGGKSALVSEYRRRLISELLKRTVTSSQCPSCRGYIPTFHRHANTKIFQNPLRRTMQAVMDLKKMSTDAVMEQAVRAAETHGAESRFRAMEAAVADPAAGSADEEDMLMDDDSADDDTQRDGEPLGSDTEDPEDIRRPRVAKSHGSAPSTAATPAAEGMKYMTPQQVFEHLRELFVVEGDLLRLVFASQDRHTACDQIVDHRIFFTQVLAVTPCRFRPPAILGDSVFDHPQNGYLAEIIRLNARLLELGAGVNSSSKTEQVAGKAEQATASSTPLSHIIEGWTQLQEQVNFLFDSSRNTNVAMGKLPPAGIKQLLEKKEGLFRKHMMGKRVNFAARSVISPDPNLDVGEIGVPLVFARRLTYPEPVTSYNVAKLQGAVINGPESHPGASHVQLEDGTLQALEALGPAARRALAAQLAPGKKVLRNLEDGDVVLMNRQPTLHKPSMMAHRVRVLAGEKTLRMHYANCDAYNADFDGDEMNMHFPQNELARAELASIAATEAQYLVPTDGSPLRGLIQDHVVTGVILTLKDTFLDEETFQQLLFAALTPAMAVTSRRLLLDPPAILRPHVRWTGKQLISALLANVTRGLPPLTLTSRCKTSARLWTASHADEALVHISAGYWVHGVMDKAQIGASATGLIHACYELYGGMVAGQLLSTLSRLLTRWTQLFGFTCRMDDLLLDVAAEETRHRLFREHASASVTTTTNYIQTALGLVLNDAGQMEETSASGTPSTANLTDDLVTLGLERVIRDDELARGLDGAMKMAMNGVTSRVIDATLPQGQKHRFPANNMSLMTLTGAKGSMVNFSQISGCLGQQELEGRRVPSMVSGRTLPAFSPWCMEARAGGYIAQRFLTGIRPPEFFFHCMAGREGLIDTAVKTARSGYLQRCLIKHLETLRVHYDHTVRTDDQSIVQFCYGEDGIDVTKQALLAPDQLSFCARNFAALLARCQPQRALERLPSVPEARKAARRALRRPRKHPPVLSLHSPAATLGAVSERFHAALEDFIRTETGSLFEEEVDEDEDGEKNRGGKSHGSGKTPAPTLTSAIDANQFRVLMWLKYMQSLAEPGEAVGLLAAQSLGEPSTQMTLNTFHFAGFGAKNVTLGIPRLREIIMTASPNLRTPAMTLVLRPEYASAPMAAELVHRLTRLSLRTVLQDITVSERLVARPGSRRQRVYSVRLDFLSPDELRTLHSAHPDDLKRTVENALVGRLTKAIERILRLRARSAAGTDTPDDLITVTRSRSEPVSRPVDDAEETREGREGRAERAAASDSDSDHDDNLADSADLDGAAAKRRETGLYDGDGDGEDEDEERETRGADGSDADMDEDSPAGQEDATLDDTAVAGMTKGSLMETQNNIHNYSFVVNKDTVSAVFDLVYPASTPKLLLLDIIERNVPDVVIRHVPGIQRAHFVPPARPEDAATISTEGINFAGMLATLPFDAIDHPLTTSNSVHAILQMYGVEAARATIVAEISAVFAVYGISIDPRHLSLIADYMTLEGGYRAFNRAGMETAASPLLKMTFETTVQYLKGATMIGETDELVSPAARIVMGLPVALGTGAFELRHPI